MPVARWSVLAMLCLALAAPALAAALPKPYQVTGPSLSISDAPIGVQNATTKWEIGRDAATKVTGDLEAGAKVTIEYRMKATHVEAKPAAAADTRQR